jgi:hypothetical protein
MNTSTLRETSGLGPLRFLAMTFVGSFYMVVGS